MKKLIVIMIPVALIVTIVVLGMAGIVKIPGLTPPAKGKKNLAAMYADKDDKKLAKKVAAKPPVKPPLKAKPKAAVKTTDPEQGAAALAEVWNGIKSPDLAVITKGWSDDDLAKVLTHMDTGKVAKFLAQLAKGDSQTKVDPNPTRASTLSKKLQVLGSAVAPENAGT